MAVGTSRARAGAYMLAIPCQNLIDSIQPLNPVGRVGC